MSVDHFFITNISKDVNHKESIKELLSSARNVIIISPFITDYGIDFVKNCVTSETELQIITELTANGIASYSQSPIILKNISKRSRTKVYLNTKGTMHSKIYLIDDNVLITSANLTSGGLENNFEAGVLFSDKTKDKFSLNLWTEILKRLKNDFIPYLLSDAIEIDESNIQLWIDFELEFREKSKVYLEFIQEIGKKLPQKGFSAFCRNFEGKDIGTEILASFNIFKFEEKSWDVFYRYKDPNFIDKYRDDLTIEINPILKNVFHSIKQSNMCSVNFKNIRDDIFSHNLQVTKFLPNYRNLYLNKIGIGGNNFKKHVKFPAFVLSMLKKDDEKIFQIRVGVEENLSTDPLCEYAKKFLENLVLNSKECISRFSEMKGDWFLFHGQDRLEKREIVLLKDLSEDTLKDICNSYLRSQEPADIAIGNNYFWSENSMLSKPKDFINSLASDLNHLNYFFELAH